MPPQTTFSMWHAQQRCEAAPLTGSAAPMPIAGLMLALGIERIVAG